MVTAAPTDERFAGTLRASEAALGGADAWRGREVRVPDLPPRAVSALTAALDRLGASVGDDVGDAPSESGSIELVEAAAWQQTVLTTVGRATNLGFAQAAVHIHGAGPIGLGLARRLSGFGARVTLSADRPTDLLAASLEGFGTGSAARIDPRALFLVATGEAAAFSPARLDEGSALVVVDAARPGERAAVDYTASGDEVRPGLVPVVTGGREAVVLRVEALRDDAFDAASTDIRAAFALLHLADASTADTELARIVLA